MDIKEKTYLYGNLLCNQTQGLKANNKLKADFAYCCGLARRYTGTGMEKPNSVYKYLDLENIDRILEVLVESKLYFAKPSQFNDPFEFKPKRMSLDTSDLEGPLVTQYLDPSLDFSYELICKQLDNFGVSCFSAKKDDIIMWSHYAGSHKGMCLGFDTKHEFFKLLSQVSYQPERQELVGSDQEDIFRVMLRKHTDWKYEDEWRLIQKIGGDRMQFPENILSSVVFGAYCTAARQSLVRKLLVGRNVQFYQAIIDKFEFKINIVPCA